jgi:hypothetical protein
MNDTTQQTGTTVLTQQPVVAEQPQQADPTKTTEQAQDGKTLLTQQPVDEQKTEGADADKKPEDKKADEKKAAAIDPKAFKMPEGVTLETERVSAFVDILNNAELEPQARAQQLLDFHASEMRRQAEAPLTAWNEAVEKWTKDLAADQQIGTGNPKNPLKTEALASIAKFIDANGGKELREALDLTGAGTNPTIVRLFHKMALKMTEGGHVSGNGPVPTKPNGTGAGALYPDLKP